MASLGEQLSQAESKQLIYSEKKFMKHCEEDEVDWHKPGSLYGYGNWELNYCMEELTTCEDCQQAICGHEAKNCMKCKKTICGLKCQWIGTLNEKDPKCKLHEFIACKNCKDELEPTYPNMVSLFH